MGWADYYIQKLKKGEIVKFRPRGNSMIEKIKSKQLCTIIPISENIAIEIDDIVLCTVKGQQYLHLVTAIRGTQFQISNNKGHINGWTSLDKIYGKLVDIEK